MFLTDPLAMPRLLHRRYRAEQTWVRRAFEKAARVPVIAIVFCGFFAISWRPLYCFFATASFFVIFTGISRAKYRFIREPLVFSDIALVFDVFRHQEIFYATSLNLTFWIVSFLYVFGISALFMYFEPSALPDHAPLLWISTGLVVGLGPWLALLGGPVKTLGCRAACELTQTFEIKNNTARFGTFGSVFLHFVIWLGLNRKAVIDALPDHFCSTVHALQQDGADKPPLILAWQSESFYDLRHLDAPDMDLPNLDRLRQRSVQWGRMTNVFEGGYTLRTEFSVLSGLAPDLIPFDASHPYLRAGSYAEVAWPERLRKAGWRTEFVHPYEKTFFFRHRAIPQLGFDRATMLDAFDHDPARDGPYVSDLSLTGRVMAQVKASCERPTFIFVASMANHGPWQPGRCGALTDPVAIYLELLKRADDALGALAEQLDMLSRPVWLLFYGDHAPLLKSVADPFPDPRTDYVIVPLGGAVSRRQKTFTPQQEAPWNLMGALLGHASLDRKVIR